MSDFIPCPHCGAKQDSLVELTPNGPHYGKAICGKCNRFMRWIPKPDNEKRKRESRHTDLVRKYSQGFCELCLITQENLPINETLEAHHVVEYRSAGEADRSNIWILCTRCHKLVHWSRTYIRHLIPDGVLADDSTEGIEV